MNSEAGTIWTRRQWDDWRLARYRATDIGGLHWSTISGGVGKRAPQPFLHGYVQCDGMLEGELAHSGIHGVCPHQIKVCITKKGNDRRTFEYLVGMAGPKPAGSV